MTTEPSSMLGPMRQKISRARSSCKELKNSTPWSGPLARLLLCKGNNKIINYKLIYNIIYNIINISNKGSTIYCNRPLCLGNQC